MMKKNVEKIIKLNLIGLIIISIFSYGSVKAQNGSEASTLAELRQELKNLQNKKRRTENQKHWTKDQINQKNNEIVNANKEISDSKTKINEAKLDIENTNKEIESLKEETNKIIVFYQKISNENIYAHLISESTSMTDLIMNMDTIKEIMDYNKNQLIKLEDLIKTKEQLQVDLKNREKELTQKIADYKNKIDELDSSLIQMQDISMNIDGEIKIVQDNIKNYEAMRCGENEKFTVCMERTSKIGNNNTWLKPTTHGIITSVFGRRYLNGRWGFHSGIDIGLAEGTPVYSATNGRVVHIVNRSNCGGNQVFIESKVNGQYYTMHYAHLLSINVKRNQVVTNQTMIGKSGGGATTKKYDRCTTGGHLHFGVAKSKFTTWSNYQATLINPPGYPGRGVRFYSRTQWFD